MAEAAPPPVSAPTPEPKAKRPAAGRFAFLVGAGILLSRLSGLLRTEVFAHYFGNTLFADAFNAALRIPNILQNLLGEGTLSASFIPVYAELLEEGKDEAAGQLAGAIFALLLAVVGLFTLLGVFFAPYLVDIVAVGFNGERRDLAVAATRIIFPMTGILVLFAWGLGILNSHRRFFLAYVAPVLWNAAMIAALLIFGGRLALDQLVIALSWAALVGGVLQVLVLVPRVLKLEPNLVVRLQVRSKNVRTVVANAGPVVLGRGVVQLSAYVDTLLASLLAFGAVAAMTYAMTLYLLPISLFGMSVAASELPELARQKNAAAEVLRTRVSDGLRQIAVYVVPSTVSYLVLGDVIIAALYQTGKFGPDDTLYVWTVLAGFTIGLMASTGTRLFSSTYYALQDTKTPALVALLRVVLTAAVGYALMRYMDRWQIAGHGLGAFGLTAGSGIAAWVEWAMLRRVLRRRIGEVGAGAGAVGRMIAAALIAAALGRGIAYLLPPTNRFIEAALVLGPFGVAYFVLARAFGVAEAGAAMDRVLRRLRRH